MRNLGLIVAFWLATALPTSSLALGLGEIEVSSFLNQPLKAEIEVLSARPGEIDDLLVSLASRDAFTRAGLARPNHLTNLRFAVQKSEDGDTAVILVTTRNSIKEPFLNFLVEADWSKGRLLREFTVLLDPPFYAEQPAPAETMSQESVPAGDDSDSMTETEPTDSAAVGQSTESTETITEPIALTQSSASDSTPVESASEPPASTPPASSEYIADESENIIEGDVLVVKDDTLWSIASRFKDDAHSMSQVMLAFQRANPGAFVDGNINNMKVGSVLRVPSADDLDAYDQQSAYAEVLTQNGLWDEYVERVTGVSPAMGGTDDGTGESGEAEQGELSLLMPSGEGGESTGSGDSAELEQLRTRLAFAEEDLEASRIENADLESRIAELQARVSKFEELQKMVEIEDDSLAQIQSEQTDDLAESGVEAAVDENEAGGTDATQPDATDAISESMEADEEALLEELLAEEAMAQAEEQAALQTDEMAEDAGESISDDAMSDDAMSDDSLASDEMVEEPAIADTDAGDSMTDDEAGLVEEAEAETTVTPPAPVIVTESAGSDSVLDGILPPAVTDMIPSVGGIFGDPIILAAIGGVVVLLLTLVVVKRRKAAQGDDSGADDLFAGDDEEELTPIHLTESELPASTDIDVPSEEDMAAEIPASDQAEEEDEYGATAIISAADMPEPQADAPASASGEQDDVLNEVDVYLAYGLYDNAEDLLKTNLAEHPDRGDYRSKLLDTYFATKNATAFVEEAHNLKAMGDAGKGYWDRVQIMGYELAPDNALFSDAKGSGLSAADLEIAKPQEADFDLGGTEKDDTNFSSTDFNLGEEDAGDSLDDSLLEAEAGNLESTQPMPDQLDDIGGELEFSMDDDVAEAPDLPSEELDFPDDLDFEADVDLADDDETDLGDIELLEDAEIEADVDLADDDETDLGDIELLEDAKIEEPKVANAEEEILDFDVDEVLDGELNLDSADDDALELDVPDENEVDHGKTEIITPNYEETAIISSSREEGEELLVDAGDDESNIDLGMEDTAMKDFDEFAEETGGIEFNVVDDDDEEDISIIDFGGEDFVEPTDIVESISDDDIAAADGGLASDEEEGEEIRTGTFAPGDFDEPAEAGDSIDDLDDMDDLMLPDDVDEVSTKLDLARAFIDMGDTEGARGSLEEVMSEGSAEQKAEAKSLLDSI